MLPDALFLNTPSIIYLVERNRQFFQAVQAFIDKALEHRTELYTSVLTVSEVLIKPQKLNQVGLTDQFEQTIGTLTEVLYISWDIAKLSANLRAKYTSLRAVDSLQIACAIKAEAGGFLTNDRRLISIKEIPIILIKEL